MIDGSVMLKGFAAALVVGFVTASIRTWVDRFFLLIMLVGIVGLPIGEAILVNLVVVSLSALLMVFRQRKALNSATSARTAAILIVVAAVSGGVAGRIIGAMTPPEILVGVLGGYAVLVGLRIFFIKPLSERETKAHPAWLAPVALGSGLLAGFLSAGGKPFAVPAYNNAMGHHPQAAYAYASLGVVAAAWSALATQFGMVAVVSSADLVLGLYEFALVTIVALLVNRLWSEKLNRIVNLTIAPILIIVGLRFIIFAV
jgi:uncharacterized membrane protein YfcA